MNRRIGFLIFFFLVAMGFLYALFRRKKLDKNFSVATGHIENIETFPQNVEVFASYYFIVSEKTIRNKSSIPFSKKSNVTYINRLLSDQWLPVIYEKGHLGNSRMLFTKEEIRKYKVSIDDRSLLIINSLDSLANN